MSVRTTINFDDKTHQKLVNLKGQLEKSSLGAVIAVIVEFYETNAPLVETFQKKSFNVALKKLEGATFE